MAVSLNLEAMCPWRGPEDLPPDSFMYLALFWHSGNANTKPYSRCVFKWVKYIAKAEAWSKQTVGWYILDEVDWKTGTNPISYGGWWHMLGWYDETRGIARLREALAASAHIPDVIKTGAQDPAMVFRNAWRYQVKLSSMKKG